MKLLSIFALSILVFTFSPVQAQNSERTFTVPREAEGREEFSLGLATDPQSGRLVEGRMIIHYRAEPSHKSNQPSAPKPDKTASCYKLLSKGAKWKTVEPWLINPANTRGLSSDFVFNTFTSSIAKWEDAADGVVGNGVSKNILGDGTVTSQPIVSETNGPDGQNEVYFAKMVGTKAIGLTIIWGYFGGSASKREIVEWDQIYDDVTYDWSSTGEANKMDFENVATHELGHSVGLADFYTKSCTTQTMYGYAMTGETQKRDLGLGDIAGVKLLYQ